MKSKVEVTSEAVVHFDSGAYTSFPHVLNVEGTLWCVFRKASEFSRDAALNGVATHHDPNSSIWISSSDDGGASWSTPNLVYKGPYGVNDPAITLLDSGDMLIRFVVLEITSQGFYSSDDRQLFSHRTEHGLITKVRGNLVLRAAGPRYDDWYYVGMSDNEEIGPSCSRDPILELQDGTLIMPVYTGAPKRSDQSWCLRSFDGGVNWVHPVLIADDPDGLSSQMRGINFNETSIIAFGEGALVAMVRGDSTFHTDSGFMPVGGVGKLYTVHSNDGGLSWGRAIDNDTFGQPGALLNLGGDRCLATYGVRKAPYGVRCKFSEDRGVTWGNEIIIYDEAPIWDCGYPFTVETKSGGFCTVFYTPDENGIRYIKSIQWNLNYE